MIGISYNKMDIIPQTYSITDNSIVSENKHIAKQNIHEAVPADLSERRLTIVAAVL